MNAVANTAKINTDGLSIEVERVANHATIHGARGPRVYVRIRPAGAEPGRDYGPRTCLTLAPEDARACWRAFKTDQPCAFKIDQGWMPKIEVFGEFRV